MISPWLTMRRAAEHLDFRGKDGQPRPRQAREFIDAQGIPTKKRGHCVVVKLFDLEAALEDRRVQK